ncbi:MAG: 23S rRNA (pseudouridine(1915)-N(3))-methyltransferase RlmH [Lachnospiraceae bacterium]|nr:23S rRNA (pseudouridine(1915)-N(3))-methyltransferase RlmH [Lachnospiraceae bacterium]
MKIRILAVGKVKEAFFRDAVGEYCKRLTRYAKLEITEVADEKTPDMPSASEREAVLSREGTRLLHVIRDTDYVIALAINGKRFSSEDFAGHIDSLMTRGKSSLVFVIGGSLGLSDAVLSRADETLSFSDFTFPHQLMRVILLEQIYRAFRICSHEPYHK